LEARLSQMQKEGEGEEEEGGRLVLAFERRWRKYFIQNPQQSLLPHPRRRLGLHRGTHLGDPETEAGLIYGKVGNGDYLFSVGKRLIPPFWVDGKTGYAATSTNKEQKTFSLPKPKTHGPTPTSPPPIVTIINTLLLGRSWLVV
jgi:hypothetical protein